MKIGNKVICIISQVDYNPGVWIDNKTREKFKGPNHKDVLIITGFKNNNNDLCFNEFPSRCYNKKYFIVIEEKSESIYLKLETKKVLEKEKIIAN